MGIVAQTFRIGSPSGQIKVIYGWDGEGSTPVMVSRSHIPNLSIAYPESFSINLGMVCHNATTYQRAINMGFDFVVDISSYTRNNPYKLYCSDNNYYAWFVENNVFVKEIHIGDRVVGGSMPGGNNLSDALFSIIDLVTPDNTRYAVGWRIWGWSNDTTAYSYAEAGSNTNYLELLKEFYSGSGHFTADPYGPGGTSEPAGGGGTFDDNSDQIADSPIQSISLIDTGFARVYNPTLSQVKDLARYVWTDDNFLQTLVNKIKARIENPIDAIISLSLLPCPIPNGTAEEVKVVYVPTGVMMPPATSQFVEVDCGSVDLTEYYGSALDYSPYTKVQAYLPYIGQVTLDTDEVMGNTINIKYRIDIVTGICVAKIFVGGSVLYQFNGHCAINMPLSSADFSSYFGAFLNLAKGAGAIIAAGTGNPGIAAGIMGIPGPSQTTTAKTITREGGGFVRTERNPATGRQVTSGTTTSKPMSIDINETTERHSMSYGEMAARSTSNTVSSVMASKTIVEHSGSFSGNSGVLAIRRPYLIIERPRMCRPDRYGILTGFPSMMAANLGDLTGYTEVQNIHLTNFHGALNPETGEIAELLKAGVVL